MSCIRHIIQKNGSKRRVQGGSIGQASKVASKHVRVRRQASKQADKHQGGIQSEPCPVEACFNGEKF